MRSNRSRAMLTLLSTLLFFYGFYLGGIQLVIADISASFGMEITGIGILVAVSHIASLILPTLLGILADRVGKKQVLLTFAGVLTVGCLLAGFSGNILVYAAGAVMIGAGTSVCESVSSAVLSELNPEKAARYINISQCALSAGAVIAPFVIQWLMPFFTFGWRLLFYLCAGAFLLIGALLALYRFPNAQKPGTVPKSDASGVRFFRNRLFVCVLFAMAIYVGLENGVGYFVESHFDISLNRSDLGAFAISCYWIGMTLARLVGGVWIKDMRAILLLHFGAVAALFLWLLVADSPWLTVVLCGLVGFAYGPIWCTLVAQAASIFPAHTAKATGMMSSFGSLGSISAPILMGFISDTFHIRAGFLFLALLGLGGFLLIFLGKEKKA